LSNLPLRVSNLPLRASAGAYIANAGISKWFEPSMAYEVHKRRT
jgi:hypothetical protein